MATAPDFFAALGAGATPEEAAAYSGCDPEESDRPALITAIAKCRILALMALRDADPGRWALAVLERTVLARRQAQSMDYCSGVRACMDALNAAGLTTAQYEDVAARIIAQGERDASASTRKLL